jgi:signal transduction histidine kinase
MSSSQCCQVWLTLVLLAAATARGADTGETKRVLLLFSESKDLPANVLLERAAKAQLEKEWSGKIEFYMEYLDAARFRSESHYQLFREHLLAKYRLKHLDLVIAFLGGEFQLAGISPEELFPDLPLVFVVVGEHDLPPQVRNPRITGVVRRVDVVGTLKLILNLRPETRRIIVIGGTSPLDRLFLEPTKSASRSFPEKVEFEFWTNRPATELRSAVAVLPEGNVVLYTSMFLDVEGHAYQPQRMAGILSASASVPVFVLFDTMVGEGPVGGSVMDFGALGTRAGEMAAGILDGKSPADYPIEIRTNGVAMVDWRALHRWGINPQRLPAGTDVQFRPPTMWEQHRGFFIATLCIVLGQAATITVLLVQRQHRRKAESEARELAGRLLSAHEEERTRLARELHDGLSQRVALMAVELEMFGHRPPSAPSEVAATMNEMSAQAKALSKDLHRLSHGLHPAKLEQLGLATATAGLCREVEQVHQIAVECECRNVSRWLPPDVALCVYRITQEALQNVAKHSGASHAKVELTGANGEIRLSVTDDGKGFDLKTAPADGGLGLVSMRERVRAVHGQIHWRSKPGRGTSVFVRVPLPAKLKAEG